MICGIRAKWPSWRRTPLYPLYIMGVSVLNSQPVQFNFSTVLKIISVKRGNLFKWTNYLSGWQCRYVVVERGTLSYYRNELDMEFGCRGVIHLGRLFILFSPSWQVYPFRTVRVYQGWMMYRPVGKANKLKLKLLNMTSIHRDLIYFYQMEHLGISGLSRLRDYESLQR